MPLTWLKSNATLAIKLEGAGPQKSYSPGDTLIGHVIRKHHVVSPHIHVALKLCGRAKVKIDSLNNSNNSTTYRSCFQLVNETQSSQTLYDGPVHLPEGGESVSWAFAITIPTHVPPRLSSTNHSSYLPLDRESVAQQTLPSTIESYGSRLEAFVEYWLEATLQIDGHGDSQGTYNATLPFTLRTYRDGPPIHDVGLKTFHRMYGVASQRLVPGMEGSELSVKDKMKKFFQTSSVPAFRFQLEIGLPTIIQLEPPGLTHQIHTKPIAVMLRVLPNWKTSSEILRDTPQKVRLASLQLSLESTTEGRADGNSGVHKDDTRKKVDMVAPNSKLSLADPIYIPSSADLPPLNVGELINLRFGYHGPVGQRSPFSLNVYPSTETYNFRHTYMLEWEVKIEIAEEIAKIGGWSPVRVLDSIDPSGMYEQYTAAPSPNARSDSWIQPPPESDPPPSFTHVQEEDIALNSKDTSSKS